MKLLVTIGMMIFPVLAATARAEKPIVAQIFLMPEAVEPASVTAAGHYILAHHLVRPLTKLDKFGKIQGDLAIKWQHTTDRKTWTLTLGEAKFSNGDAITSADVLASVERQKKLGGGVHFKFSDIVKAEAPNATTVKFTLSGPRNDFIFDLSKPEFGVLHKSDAGAVRGAASFAVSSGAYFLARKEGRSYRLKRNPHYLSDAKNDLELVMESADGQASPEALGSGKINFFTPHGNVSEENHRKVVENEKLRGERPHIGFSYWLSVHPNSTAFRSPGSRAFLQKMVQEFSSPELRGHQWEKAHQLYLPDGDGRPSAAELESTWKTIFARAKAPKGAKPKVRLISFRQEEPLIGALTAYLSQWYELEIVPYKSEEELIALVKSGKFDLKIQSNDFSSTDLSENLKVTFNEIRPYIFLSRDSKVRKLLAESLETGDKERRSRIYKDIATTLLLDGAIAPLAYHRLWFYMSKTLDTSPWSSTYPEISFWKVRAP